MTDFNILITQARLKKIAFEMKEAGDLGWACSVELCTDRGIKVSDVYLSSDSWQDEHKLEFPVSFESIVRHLFTAATPICADKIMHRHKQIETTIDVGEQK